MRLQTLAKDHLQQAYYILMGDKAFAEVQKLIAETMDAIDRGGHETDAVEQRRPSKVLRFPTPI